MEVKQIYSLMNDVTAEILGKSDLVAEDLGNIVDVGKEILNVNAVDNYVKTLVDKVGKVIFVNRPYSGKIPSVLMDAWEYGSILEKIAADLPTATENETWDLEDGREYKQDVFYKPKVTAKFFNSKVTFEVPISITERQVKESFTSAKSLNGFLSMLYDAVDKSMTIKADALIMRTINNMICETFANEPKDEDENTIETRCINLLARYNTKFNKSLTANGAITDPDFLRFASLQMALYADRLGTISTIFNVGGKERFTDKANLHCVLLSDFAMGAEMYLYSDVRHNDLVKFPKAETIPFWQGSGKGYEFADCAKIVKSNGSNPDTTINNVVGVLFDRNALGVCNLDRRVTTSYNAKAEFFNNFYKFDASYFNDTNENFVVFYLGE